jgi:spore coat protein U-like protein
LYAALAVLHNIQLAIFLFVQLLCLQLICKSDENILNYNIGGHTIGRAQCALFSNRLFNFSTTSSVDPMLNATMAANLQCSSGDGNTKTLDRNSTDVVDHHYFQNPLDRIFYSTSSNEIE